MILKIEQHAKREYLKYVVRMRNTQFYVRATDNIRTARQRTKPILGLIL